MSDFWAAAEHKNLPAVSFLKAGGYEQGGCGCGCPYYEQPSHDLTPRGPWALDPAPCPMLAGA